MPTDNFTRMIHLADEFFETKNDPSQLSIDEQVMKRLHGIHPATMGEIANEQGPVAWTIVLPTSAAAMELFLMKEIGEQELMERAEKEKQFESIYLCSALVLPEQRGRGLARQLIDDSIRSIVNDHPIRTLYYWAFSTEGDALARSASRTFNLPLRKRK